MPRRRPSYSRECTIRDVIFNGDDVEWCVEYKHPIYAKPMRDNYMAKIEDIGELARFTDPQRMSVFRLKEILWEYTMECRSKRYDQHGTLQLPEETWKSNQEF